MGLWAFKTLYEKKMIDKYILKFCDLLDKFRELIDCLLEPKKKKKKWNG